VTGQANGGLARGWAAGPGQRQGGRRAGTARRDRTGDGSPLVGHFAITIPQHLYLVAEAPRGAGIGPGIIGE
jgi:hypothetical protein